MLIIISIDRYIKNNPLKVEQSEPLLADFDHREQKISHVDFYKNSAHSIHCLPYSKRDIVLVHSEPFKR